MISFENKVSFVLVFRRIERIEKYNDLYYYVKREFFVNNTSLNKKKKKVQNKILKHVSFFYSCIVIFTQR